MLAVSQVSPLRKKMTEDMQLHGLSENTQDLYARAVSQLSKYVHRSPDKVTEEDIGEVLQYLGRYVFRIAITNSRLESFANGLRPFPLPRQ